MDTTQYESGDSAELEALFDTLVSAAQTDDGIVEESAIGKDVYESVGHLARDLYERLHALGYDQALESAAASIPDAKDRLGYVAELTEQAAVRALTAVESARPLQDDLIKGAGELDQRWEALFAGQLGLDQFKLLVGETRQYLAGVPERARATNDQLREIMMAQDFQDLTGQVIKRIVNIVQEVEGRLLELLIQNSPEKSGPVRGPGLENGPVIKSAGRADVVTSQEQVDSLLESLGF